MRLFRFASLVVLALGAAAAALAGDEVPEPRLDRVDYAHPEKYLDLPATLGKRATLEKIAKEIEGADAAAKLAAIGAWIDAHLKYDASSFDHWRDVDELLADATYGGCADHAEIYGGIARACGIPAVWVKSLDLEWIAWFRAHPDQPKGWNGHVFLEVHLGGSWRLYDATQHVLYETYDTRQRILPGMRLAYDKGGDAWELVLSTRWELWQQQTRRFVETLDLPLVPVAPAPPPTPASAVFVCGGQPAWSWVADRCKALGRNWVAGGGSGFDEWMPRAKGRTLVVLNVAGRTALPARYRALVPVDDAKAQEILKGKASEILRRKADDGTDVILVLARDDAALRDAIAAMKL